MTRSAPLRFQGRAWVFGDFVPTDDMGDFYRPVEGGVMAGRNPGFTTGVRPGDIVVAGKHFGQSSGRALAVRALRNTGVSCVVAESIARTFMRNSYEMGFPVLECPGVSQLVRDGDIVSVD